jgi:hypothetical protein
LFRLLYKKGKRSGINIQFIIVIVKKTQRKSKVQSSMYNPETLVTLCTRDTLRRQNKQTDRQTTKQKRKTHTYQKTTKMINTDSHQKFEIEQVSSSCFFLFFFCFFFLKNTHHGTHTYSIVTTLRQKNTNIINMSCPFGISKLFLCRICFHLSKQCKFS